MSSSVVQSAITAVKVFRVGAKVTREAVVKSENGRFPDTIRLSGLPLCLDDNSVSVRITAEDPGSPSATDMRVGLDVPEIDPTLAEPENKKISEARQHVKLIEDRLTQCTNALRRIELLDPPMRPEGKKGDPPPATPTAARLALLDFRHAQIDRLGAEATELRRELSEAREHLSMLEQHRRNATTERNAREHELRKSLDISLVNNTESGPDSCRIIVEYQVPGARWAPSYVVRYSSAVDHSEICLRALVCQATGEDWNGIDLVVSTADAQSWTELPEMPSLRIGRAQPIPARTGWREPPTGAEELFADYDRSIRLKPLVVPEDLDMLHAADADFEDEDDYEGMVDEPMVECGAGSYSDLEEPSPAFAAPMPPPEVVAASIAPLMAKSAKAKAPRRYMAGDERARKAMPPPMSPAKGLPETGSEIMAPADLMDYRRLRFPSPADEQRSTLQPARHHELYLESLISVNIDITVDIIAAIEAARSTADLVQHASGPPNSVFPVSWEGFDHAWQAETKIDIPSDQNFHNVPLLARTGESTMNYIIVPSEGPEAWRYMTLINPLETPLPEGPADVYAGDDFLLTSQLHTVAPGGSIELGLGVEEAIKTARNVDFSEHRKGLLGGDLKLEHNIVVDVANRMATEAAVEIRERIPLSQEGDDDVEVDLVSVDPPWQEFRQKMRLIEGAYRWKHVIPPGGNQTFRTTYVITIPSKNELVGGNRRER